VAAQPRRPHERESIRVARASAVDLSRLASSGVSMRWKLAVAMTFLILSACGRTQRAGPPIPFDEPGACPFQCCTYREWSVDWGTDIRTDKRDDAPVAFHVAVNDTVTTLTGVVTTTKIGRATASRQVNVGTSHIPVAAGQPIYLIRNVGSGDWKIWINGQTDE